MDEGEHGRTNGSQAFRTATTRRCRGTSRTCYPHGPCTSGSTASASCTFAAAAELDTLCLRRSCGDEKVAVGGVAWERIRLPRQARRGAADHAAVAGARPALVSRTKMPCHDHSHYLRRGWHDSVGDAHRGAMRVVGRTRHLDAPVVARHASVGRCRNRFSPSRSQRPYISL